MKAENLRARRWMYFRLLVRRPCHANTYRLGVHVHVQAWRSIISWSRSIFDFEAEHGVVGGGHFQYVVIAMEWFANWHCSKAGTCTYSFGQLAENSFAMCVARHTASLSTAPEESPAVQPSSHQRSMPANRQPAGRQTIAPATQHLVATYRLECKQAGDDRQPARRQPSSQPGSQPGPPTGQGTNLDETKGCRLVRAQGVICFSRSTGRLPQLAAIARRSCAVGCRAHQSLACEELHLSDNQLGEEPCSSVRSPRPHAWLSFEAWLMRGM